MRARGLRGRRTKRRKDLGMQRRSSSNRSFNEVQTSFAMSAGGEWENEYPGLKPFVLSDVQLTGATIGGGAYGKVEEVTIPVRAAGKTIHDTLIQEAGYYTETPKAVTQFVKECYLMSTLRHPNIVQFLGVAFLGSGPFLPGSSRLPTLVMEKLVTNLHDLLDCDPPQRNAASPLSNFSLALRVSVLQNVASGLAYLHERNEPIIHRDLSARNILLDSDMVAKIGDLGVARILDPVVVDKYTKGPGAALYMPPEAFAPGTPKNYDTGIDLFSLGVVAIFTIGGVFPCNLQVAVYSNEKGQLVARSELQRRSEYMRYVNEHLRANGQLRGDHPLIRLIQRCLQNEAVDRPNICQVIAMLDEARAGIVDGNLESNKRQLIKALQTQPTNQNLDCIFRDLVTKNADLYACIQAKDREIAMLRQQLDSTPKIPRGILCQISGPGKASATVNHPTSATIELTNSSGARSSLELNVTAQLELILKPPFPGQPSGPPSSVATNEPINLHVITKSSTRYEIEYTPISRGQHKIHVHVNEEEVFGSPFTVVVYPDPRQIEHPVRSITGLWGPYCCAFNLREDLIASETGEHRLAVFAARRQLLRSISSQGDDENEMTSPRGVAVDGADNIYVSSRHKLQKFTGSGELIHCIGQSGKKEGEFSDPRGITLHNNEIYVSDIQNHRIQVFDLDLNFVRTFGTKGKQEEEFDEPIDIQFDEAGNMFVAEWGNRRVQVMDTSGHHIRSFGEGILYGPSGLFIADQYIYVSDMNKNYIAVFEMDSGEFVTKFCTKEGEIRSPYSITGDSEGFLYICDSGNNRIQIF